jgi:hypothetical protein
LIIVFIKKDETVLKVMYKEPSIISGTFALLLPSGQKVTLGLLTTVTLEVVPIHVYAPFPALMPFLDALTTVTLEVVPIHVYAPFPALMPFLDASWKVCDSSTIMSVLSKRWPFSFIFNQGNKVPGDQVGSMMGGG